MNLYYFFKYWHVINLIQKYKIKVTFSNLKSVSSQMKIKSTENTIQY